MNQLRQTKCLSKVQLQLQIQKRVHLKAREQRAQLSRQLFNLLCISLYHHHLEVQNKIRLKLLENKLKIK